MLRLFSLGGAGRAVENKSRGRSSATFNRLIFIEGGGGGRCCDLWGGVRRDGVHSIDILEYIKRLQLICRGLIYLFGRFERGGGG